MRISITLDDVIRAKTKQFGTIYKKCINPSIELESLDVNTKDLSKVFNFDSKKEYQDFLYKDYTFEIFGEAPVVEKMLDKNLNLWHIELNNEHPDVELSLVNPFEFNASIGFTYFFLSRIATRIREIYLPTDSSTIWDRCDVLITADPDLLEKKPEGKIAIKIETPYNKDVKADYEYEYLSGFLNDKEIIDELKKKVDEHFKW